MGSFSELTLAFTFAPETPVEVLAAFSSWRTGPEAPPLPTLEQALGPDAIDEADTYLGMYSGEDPLGPLPLLKRAGVWRWLLNWSHNAYFPGTPSCALRWQPGSDLWTLTVRTLPKMGGDFVEWIVGPLGELAIDGTRERPRFVGYIHDEHDNRPVLIWSVGEAPFLFEALDMGTSMRPGRDRFRFSLERGREAPGVALWAQDLAEACVRVYRLREAESTLEMLERQADRRGRRLAHAGTARSRGLLAG